MPIGFVKDFPHPKQVSGWGDERWRRKLVCAYCARKTTLWMEESLTEEKR
jgi:hypothetical protein